MGAGRSGNPLLDSLAASVDPSLVPSANPAAAAAAQSAVTAAEKIGATATGAAAGGGEGCRKLPRGVVQYEAALVTTHPVLLHSQSALSRSAPPVLVYSELLCSAELAAAAAAGDDSHPPRHYLVCATAIDPAWLISECRNMCSVPNKPLADPPPRYDPRSDAVVGVFAATFGPRSWELPPYTAPLPPSRARTAVFAACLLRGTVLPCFKRLKDCLAGNPASLLRPEGLALKRCAELLHRLTVGPALTHGEQQGEGSGGVGTPVDARGVRKRIRRLLPVDSRGRLGAVWALDGGFLTEELRLWVRGGAEGLVDEVLLQARSEIGR